ncbi:FecR family protein [Parasphingorhabdus cellanae]|uniref:FecR domain-containing protein n=1 Tax=Parasphingorhabdus cellanae TaxID=2806553 RepID=A0ABX7T2Z9_9SPHN|nr:FecR family protein [Parasphingorhabdus cellanae]QTD54447.1 FecR domain-containing protein [Parasphingorhabdus cellanae]
MKVVIMSNPVAKSLIIAALLSSSAAYAGTPGWQVSEISGNVTIARNGVVKIAQRQTKLAAGDVIKTGPKGRAVLLRGGEYLVVSPASHIEIAEPAKSGKVTQIIEYLGNVLFRIDKKETPHFGVKTPYMAAVVKGTTFSVSVSPEGTAVQVTEGAVEVSTLDGGASQLVTPGVIGMINANDPFSLVVINGERRVIESPNKPDVTGPKKAHTAGQSVTTSVAPTNKPAFSDLSGVITAPIVDDGVELAELTNGLVRGDVGYGSFVAVANAEEAIGAIENFDDNLGNEEIASGNDEIDSGGEETVDDKGDDSQDENDQGADDPSDENAGEEQQGGEDPGSEDQSEDQGEEDQGDDNLASGEEGDEDKGNESTDGNTADDDMEDDQTDDGPDDDDQGDDDDRDDDRDDDDDDRDDDRDDDGNNGHGNDPDGFDDSNPGRGNGNGNGNGRGNNGRGNKHD